MIGKGQTGMKHLRQLLCLLTALSLFAGAATVAAAQQETSWTIEADSQKLDIQKVTVKKNGQVNMLIYSAADNLKEKDISLSFETGDIPVKTVEPYAGNTTWLFLVDTSCVGTNTGREPIIETIRTLVEHMDENDEGQIIKTGDTGGNIELLSKRNLSDRINQDYKNIAVLNDKVTNLFDTIAAALEFLNSAKVKDHTVLVIISNGEMKSQVNRNLTEILRLIDDGDVTVYTVAYVNNTGQDQVQEFGNLALASCGGAAIQEAYDSDSNKVQSQIFNNEEHFYSLTADPVEAGIAGNMLTLEWNGAKRSYALTEKAIKRILNNLGEGVTVAPFTVGITEVYTEATTEEATEETTEIPLTPLPTPTPIPDNWIDWLLDNPVILIAGLAGLLLLLVLIIVLVLRRKPKDVAGDKTSAQNGPPNQPTPISEGIKTEVDLEPPVAPRKKGVLLVLTKEGSSHEPYTAELTDGELSVGRQSPNSVLIIDDDAKISRKHLVFQYKNNRMYVVDFSQNGTWVDGVKIEGPTEVHQQSLLRIGRTTLRVSWQILA
ncbi:MAG: FHA domain-containing protein [Blautia sp.]|nr:FHA domain-containing protein [Blautia sp.]